MRRPRQIRPFGPSALLLEWEQTINLEISNGVTAYRRALEGLPVIQECVPGYASLLVVYDPVEISEHGVKEIIFDLSLDSTPSNDAIHHRIPVAYGGIHGPDLIQVAQDKGLNPQKIIDLHCAQRYTVYILGYRPGFAFMGSLPPRLEIGRKKRPRTRVPAGSVGLAGRQTGIYPSDGPGGWQLIGRTPVSLIDSEGQTFARFAAGDRVSFYPIGTEQFQQLAKQDETWPVR